MQCSRGSNKNFWRRCRGGSCKQVNHTKYPSQSLCLALHYLPFCSRFPLPHFTLAVLFALSFPISSSFPFCLLSSALLFLPLCLKLGRLSSIWTTMIIQKIPRLWPMNLLSCIPKSFESVVVTSLAKALFKISLLVPVLYLPWAVLFFIELVALRML